MSIWKEEIHHFKLNNDKNVILIFLGTYFVILIMPISATVRK